MIELLSALTGALIGVSAGAVGNFMRRDDEAARAVVRLTSAVEHIAGEVSLLRSEMKDNYAEQMPRIASLETRVSVLESRQ